MSHSLTSTVCSAAGLHLCLLALLEFNQSVLVSRKDPESRRKAVAQLNQRLTSNGYWPQVGSENMRFYVVEVLSGLNRIKI